MPTIFSQNHSGLPALMVACLCLLLSADALAESPGQRPARDTVLAETAGPSGLPLTLPKAVDAMPVDWSMKLSETVRDSSSPLLTLAGEVSRPISHRLGLPKLGGTSPYAEVAWEAPRPLDPEESYNVLVVGDSLATGVHAGLTAHFGGHDRVNLIRESKRSTGLVNTGFYDWPANIETMAARRRIDAAVIVVGANDRMNIVHDGDVHRLLGDSWTDIYAERIDRMTRALIASGSAVYWVGMPIVDREAFARKMKGLNAIFADRARANRIRFVSTWEITSTDDGGVRTHYTTDEGRERRLRLPDGVHFTWNGYGVLASPVAELIARDFGLRLD